MKKLTKAEEEVMQIIWAKGRCTVSEILPDLSDPSPPHSTISSIARILEKKGFVQHKAYGRTYEYFPIISKESYGRKSLQSLLQNYFDGSTQRLVSYLVHEQKLDREELEQLLEDMDKTSKNRTTE